VCVDTRVLPSNEFAHRNLNVYGLFVLVAMRAVFTAALSYDHKLKTLPFQQVTGNHLEAPAKLILGSACFRNLETPDEPLCPFGVFHLRGKSRMSTEAQCAANKANAQLSTGPTTEEGKAISSQNRRKFGLTGRFTVLPWEDQEEFDLLVKRLRAEHQPTIAFETDLIEKMAQHFWLAQRAVLLQETCFDRELPICEEQKLMALYLRYQTTHERAFERCAKELRNLRNKSRKQKIGFESRERKRKEDAQKQAAEAHREANENRRQAAENRKQELHQWAVLLAEAKVDHQQVLTLGARLPVTMAAIKEEDRKKLQTAA
jgi:hypothetical protein